MIQFWSIAAALTAAALLFLLPPLLRSRSIPPDARVAANSAIYREQFEELAAELQRGVITRAEFDLGSSEIEHRIVAEHENGGPARATHRPRDAATAVAVGVLVPLAAALIYILIGNPGALDSAAAKPAASHAISAEQIEAMVQRLVERLKQTPEDAEGWAMLARTWSVLGRFDRAAEAYARLATLVPGNISGTVRLAPSLAGRVAPGDTLFVFARDVEGGRMPLAIVRARAGDLPFAFRLDDSHAMMPNARLSSHAKVIVGARISKSGDATPSAGDLQVASAPVSPGTSGLELVIDQFVK